MSYKIISKFIKDISFEIPNAEAFVTLEKEISKYILMVNFTIEIQQRYQFLIQVVFLDMESGIV